MFSHFDVDVDFRRVICEYVVLLRGEYLYVPTSSKVKFTLPEFKNPNNGSENVQSLDVREITAIYPGQ